ncbi:MAG: ChaB family protein [Pseudonocardia sp.]
MPGEDELPSTVRRSDEHAQSTWVKTYDSAMDSYDDGARARRTAFSALKHSYEKVGDHWEAKDRRGPSDEQAARGDVTTDLPTAGGVDANASKQHLYDVARNLDVRGRSSMTKDELVDAIGKANDRATRRVRERS